LSVGLLSNLTEFFLIAIMTLIEISIQINQTLILFFLTKP